jgi:predicted N-acetyltransferase YhbS
VTVPAVPSVGLPAIRRATPDDTEAITGLLRTVFEDNPKTDPRVYEWQYWRNPLGPAVVIVAEADGMVVGHAAAYVAPGRLRGARVRIAHGGDAAVHPEHRGAGLFTRLSEARARAVADEGAAAMMVLPNPDAVGANVRSGLEQVGRVPVWIRPMDDAWVAGRAHLPRAVVRAGRRMLFGDLEAGAARRSQIVPSGFDALHTRLAPQLGSGLARGAQWWRWRYTAAPGADYRAYELRRGDRLVAVAVVADRLRMGAPFWYVFDLLAEDRACASAVIGAALTDEEADPVVAAALLGMPGTWAAQMARGCGFRRLPRALEPRPMVLGVVGHRAPVETLGPWHVTWGDHDHV